MKSLIFITVLAALAVCNDAASIPNKTALYQEEGFVYREDINMYQSGDVKIGNVSNVLLDEQRHHLPGIPHTVQRLDISYRGTLNTRISALSFNWYLGIMCHTYTRGLGSSQVTIRVTSDPGGGIFIIVQFWGRDAD